MKIIVVLILTCLASVSFAGLGETLEESIERYGPVLKQTQSEYLPPSAATVKYEFFKNGFQIEASFVNGKCAWLIYTKPGEPIFDTEIRTLLDNNAEGSHWTTGEDAHERFFKKKIKYWRADGLADAEYEEMGTVRELFIITKAWRDATSQASGL